MNTSRIAVLFLVLSASALAQSSVTVGGVQGSVVDSLGQPLSGALVRYGRVVTQSIRTRSSAFSAPTGVVSGSATTDARGTFSVAGLPAGTYVLCAQVPSAPYVDPCVWRNGIPVTVVAGSTANATLALEKGVFLKVRVNDPAHLLSQNVDGPWTARRLLVGVEYGKGAYEGLHNVAADSAGRDYQLIIPTDIDFRLRLFSSDVTIADVSGNALDASNTYIPFQAAIGGDQAFTFTITGASAVSR